MRKIRTIYLIGGMQETEGLIGQHPFAKTRISAFNKTRTGFDASHRKIVKEKTKVPWIVVVDDVPSAGSQTLLEAIVHYVPFNSKATSMTPPSPTAPPPPPPFSLVTVKGERRVGGGRGVSRGCQPKLTKDHFVLSALLTSDKQTGLALSIVPKIFRHARTVPVGWALNTNK